MELEKKIQFPQTNGILNGIIPFAPKNTKTNPNTIPIIRPTMKYLNSIMPNCPLFNMKQSILYLYINLSISNLKTEKLINDGLN